MRYILFLLMLTIVFAGLDQWFTCSRSLIPRSLNATVDNLELRREKHPGEDDVCLVHTSNGQVIHVDLNVYKSLSVRDQLSKEFGERTLNVNGVSTQLSWSQDARGMRCALAITLTVAAGSFGMAVRQLHAGRAK